MASKESLFQKLIMSEPMQNVQNQMFSSMPEEAQNAYLNSDIDPNTLASFGHLALGATKAHPFKAAGLLGLGAGNIGGLMDNKKFGGQLGGLALGGLGASAFASENPYLAAMLTMGGGELGALFDKLRAKKEQEQVQPYYEGR